MNAVNAEALLRVHSRGDCRVTMNGLHRIWRLASTYGAYRKTAEVCSYDPIRIWVEPTSHCNLRCDFCLNRKLTREQKGFMQMELFHDLIDQVAGRVHQINLFHRGESLLHPEIGAMIRGASSRGLQTRIHTNGTVLDAEKAVEILDSGLDILSFSFDGYDKQMYEENRINACFEKTLDNIIGFLKTKKSESRKRPFVVLELMEIGDIPREKMHRKREDFLRRFKGLPLDKFVVRTPHNWGGGVEVGDGQSRRMLKPHRVPCPLLWHALAVFWDGRVMPCCQDFFGELELGNLGESSIMDLWNGDRMRELRREMAYMIAPGDEAPSEPSVTVRANPRPPGMPCATCDRIVRTTLAGLPTDYLGRFASENLLNYGWLSKWLPH